MSDTGITAPQVYAIGPDEVTGIAVDFRGVLRQTEMLTGTPTVTVTGPTTSSPAVSTTELVINGESVPAGKAVLFTVTGGTDGTDYSIKVLCSTSASRTRQVNCIVQVREPTADSP